MKCTVPIDSAQAGSTIDSSEHSDNGKTLYWEPGDGKKIRMTSTRGRFQFLALLTLATRYGDGGTNALHDSLGLTYKSGKRLPKAAKEIIQKQTEASQSPTDIDSADPKDLSNFAEDKRRMIDQALAAVGTSQMSLRGYSMAFGSLIG